MKIGLQARSALVFGTLLAITVSNFSLILMEARNASSLQSWVLHTHEVISESEDLLADLLDAETGQRGFLLTLEPSYLEPYNAGTAKAWTHFSLIKELTSDNLLQQQLLERVQENMKKKAAELNETILLAQAGKLEEALTVVRNDEGKQTMDSIRSQLAHFRGEEERLLAGRNLDFERNQRNMRLLFYIEAAVMVSLILIFSFLVQRSLVVPITGLTRSARKLGAGEDVDVVFRAGTDEISQLAEAFGTMQRKVLDRDEELRSRAYFGHAFSLAVSACSSGLGLTRSLSDALNVHTSHHPSPFGAVYLHNEDTKKLHCVVDQATSVDVAQTVSSEAGLIGAVYTTDATLVVGPDTVEGFRIKPGPAGFQSRAIVLQPIKYGMDTLGVLVLAYTCVPSRRDCEYIANLSDQIGITVVSARQSEQLKYEVGVKNRFFSILAHDLRSPFNSLLGVTRVMSESAENMSKEKLVKYARVVNASSEQAFKLVQNLLEWSQLQMDGEAREPETILLQNLTDDCIEMLTPLAQEKGIVLRNKIEGTTAFADPDVFLTALRNLINNALKFTRIGGTVEVSSSRHVNMVQVTVSDTGVGMTKEHAEVIFRIDQKTSTMGTDGETGNGLGLPLCKELLEASGGRIWVESTPGKGSQFHFMLPAESRAGQVVESA